MHKPSYTPFLSKKLRINWDRTLQKLGKLYHDPAPIRPADVPEDILEALGYRRQKRKLPKLKSNVCRTMDKIMQLFLREWNRHSQPINFSISSNFAALAKACHNKDRHTAALHVGTLIHWGFLRAKQRIKHGVQLLLNPQLLVFDQPASASALGVPGARGGAAPAAPAGAGGGVVVPAVPLPADLPAAMLQLAKNLAGDLAAGRRRGK